MSSNHIYFLEELEMKNEPIRVSMDELNKELFKDVLFFLRKYDVTDPPSQDEGWDW